MHKSPSSYKATPRKVPRTPQTPLHTPERLQKSPAEMTPCQTGHFRNSRKTSLHMAGIHHRNQKSPLGKDTPWQKVPLLLKGTEAPRDKVAKPQIFAEFFLATLGGTPVWKAPPVQQPWFHQLPDQECLSATPSWILCSKHLPGQQPWGSETSRFQRHISQKHQPPRLWSTPGREAAAAFTVTKLSKPQRDQERSSDFSKKLLPLPSTWYFKKSSLGEFPMASPSSGQVGWQESPEITQHHHTSLLFCSLTPQCLTGSSV